MKERLQHIVTEIVIVVIGLLIAFQIDRWYEDYRDRNLERKILREVKVSLEFDIKDLEDNIFIHKRALASHDSIIKKFELKEYDTLIGRHIRYVYFDLLFTPNMASYESLKNWGLNLITNDTIRTQLPQLYEFDYPILTKTEERFLEGQYFERYYQMLVNNFKEFKVYETAKGVAVKSNPKDYKKLQDNSEFQILLSLTRRSHKSKLVSYEYTIKKVRGLVRLIEAELSR